MTVITEEEFTDAPPNSTAVALRYDVAGGDSAPVIVATGRGYTADQIIKTARRHKVPLREDPGLVSALAGLNIGAQIPPEMFRAVAEVLAFIYRLDGAGRKR